MLIKIDMKSSLPNVCGLVGVNVCFAIKNIASCDDDEKLSHKLLCKCYKVLNSSSHFHFFFSTLINWIVISFSKCVCVCVCVLAAQ